MSERLTGRVVFFAPAKQFGFIKPDSAEFSGDVFFHWEQFDGDAVPKTDDRVAFEVEADPRRSGRRRAKAITPI